jgi:hypothetical protein
MANAPTWKSPARMAKTWVTAFILDCPITTDSAAIRGL